MAARLRLREATDAALAAIARSSADAVIAKTVDGVVTAWNDGATRLYGRTASEMVGQNIELIIPVATRDEERTRHARVAAGATESGYRCTRMRADGSPVDVVLSMMPVRAGGRRVTGIASISRGFSRRERRDGRFEALLEAAPDAVICSDGDGLVTFANGRVTTLLGYAPEELIGRPVRAILTDELRADQPLTDPSSSAIHARTPCVAN